MREAQRARGEKTHYDGRWRPEPGKVLAARSRRAWRRWCACATRATATSAGTTWSRAPITISNREIDDLILLRPDGVPTYNFAVVVDDWDMRITHVFRGDEHVNNTPWQINIFRALGAPLPRVRPLPDHPRRRRPEAVQAPRRRQRHGLRRRGLSARGHAQLPGAPGLEPWRRRTVHRASRWSQWFDGSHLAKSPAQWDPAKLAWVNAHYIKLADDTRLAPLVQDQLARRGVVADDLEHLARACALFKDRCATTVELADWLQMYFAHVTPGADELAAHVTDAVRPALVSLRDRFAAVAWDKAAIAAAIKETLAAHRLKMPQLAPALRVLVCGRAQTPSIDAVLALFARDVVLARLQPI